MKISPNKVESFIVDEQYHVFEGTTATVCCLTLINGFNCMGYSACIDPIEYNEEMGKDLARQKAFSKAWGYVAYGVLLGMHEADVEEIKNANDKTDEQPDGTEE